MSKREITMIIVNYLLVIAFSIFIPTYISEKTKNFATVQDIRDISSEEQSGKIEAEAKKAIMAAITKADTNLEVLSFHIALEAVEQGEDFKVDKYSEEILLIWMRLIETLDENIFILSEEVRGEVNIFRKEWPRIWGIPSENEGIKWCGPILTTTNLKRAMIKTFKIRMQKTLDNSSTKKFNVEDAEKDYKITELRKQVPEMNESVLLGIIGYGISMEKIKLMVPNIQLFATLEQIPILPQSQQ
ncbi:MAG: hypothetical protein PHW62_02325 [Candidatus Ratteibacteria bacterium]|nr:hypothetical protein [Candidatus Ratteibacteria bacterium]